jgi:hypothetical protein
LGEKLTSQISDFSELTEGVYDQTEDDLKNDNDDGNEENQIENSPEYVNILVGVITWVEQSFSETTARSHTEVDHHDVAMEKIVAHLQIFVINELQLWS